MRIPIAAAKAQLIVQLEKIRQTQSLPAFQKIGSDLIVLLGSLRL
jgi:hypothetical protein